MLVRITLQNSRQRFARDVKLRWHLGADPAFSACVLSLNSHMTVAQARLSLHPRLAEIMSNWYLQSPVDCKLGGGGVEAGVVTWRCSSGHGSWSRP